MTNYSRTTLRELKKRYLNILKKCLLANLMAFSCVLPSMAEEINPADYAQSSYGLDDGTMEKYFRFENDKIGNNILTEVNSKSMADFTVSFASSKIPFAEEKLLNNEDKNNTDIVLNFIGFEGSTPSGCVAIQNSLVSAKLGNISGSFADNKVYEPFEQYAMAYGVVIRNYLGTIKNIDGVFVSNTGYARYARGTAIYNEKGTIGNISGSFIKNGGTSSDFYSMGGAIMNSDVMGEIKGDFIGNYVHTTNSSVLGGAIMNNGKVVGNITGNFILNNVISLAERTGQGAYGGAIVNEKILGNPDVKHSGIINSKFVKNFSQSNLSVTGGAIHNSGTIGYIDENGALHGGIINSDFIGNHIYTKSLEITPKGGAIYTTKSLNIIADNGTSTFKENYVQAGGEKDYQAIYVNSADAVLTFDSRNGGEIFMHDNVNGVEGYKVHITGDKTGKMHLYNDIKNALVSVSNTTLNIGTSKVNMKEVTFEKGANLAVTINDLKNYGSLIAEKITVADDAKTDVALTFGFESLPQEGVYKVFESDTDLKLATTHEFFDIADLENGSYKIARKKADELADKFGLNEEETRAVSAVIGGNSENKAFQKVQTEIMETLKSGNKGKAKKALKVVGKSEQSAVQSVSTEHIGAVMGVVSGEMKGGAVKGHSGGDTDPRAKVYIKGLYDRTKSSMGEGFRARSKGAVLGVQSEVTEDLTLGVGYATSQTTAKEDLRRTEVDTNTGFISAHYQPNAWWVSGLATFSRGEYEEEKQILSSMGKASYNVDSWGAQVMTGYDIKLDNAIITPEVGMRYLSVKQEGYTDTLGTTVSGTRSDYLTALVGVKGTWDMGAIRPTAGVTVGYDVISDDVSALNTLANGASYTVNGEALDRLSTTVTTGVEADLGDRTTLKLEYSGTYRKEYQDHSGMLRLEWRF